MSTQKTKSIHRLEERMEGLEPGSLRHRVLQSAKGFKSSWIELGQYLYAIYQDKLYRDWGYLTFEAYCAKETGIRQATAVKLLKSYSFLEHEEPEFLKNEVGDRKPDRIPGFESVNALRLAKANENLPQKSYQELRDAVLEDVKEEADVKKKIRYVLKASTPQKPVDEAEKKSQAVKKWIAQLRAVREEMSRLGIPAKVTKKTEELLDVLENFHAG